MNLPGWASAPGPKEPTMRPRDPRYPDPSASGPPRGETARLSPGEVDLLWLALTSQQHRRIAYRAGRLQVWWNGRVRCRVDPRGNLFHVPLSVSGLNIVGEDAEGIILLAMVPLPSPEDVTPDEAQHVTVRLEGGRRWPSPSRGAGRRAASGARTSSSCPIRTLQRPR